MPLKEKMENDWMMIWILATPLTSRIIIYRSYY